MLGAFALDQLDDHERTRVLAHLDSCTRCRAELDDIAPLAQPLRQVDPHTLTSTPAPPPGLDDSIVHEIRSQQARTGQVRPRWVVPVVAAALTAIVALPLGYLAAPSPPDQPVEPVVVAIEDRDVEAGAEVIPHTWGMEITLAASGFEADETYRVVVTSDDGRRVSAGEFIGTGDQEMTCNLNSSVLREDAAGFEVRSEAGELVLTSSL
ncbi:anti-sigma factor [Allosaccharopolyspora coralli]|uniref:Anti-sigma factor n=2 Tax=Allosaccharopolyspora coralli TaxID=2665642 RepID=A0A5Q3QCJ4_9PSEU|nr:anti-sigma factor [Allosaccharopolyspora coralli]